MRATRPRPGRSCLSCHPALGHQSQPHHLLRLVNERVGEVGTIDVRAGQVAAGQHRALQAGRQGAETRAVGWCALRTRKLGGCIPALNSTGSQPCLALRMQSAGRAHLQHRPPQVGLHNHRAVHERVRQVSVLKVGARQHRLQRMGTWRGVGVRVEWQATDEHASTQACVEIKANAIQKHPCATATRPDSRAAGRPAARNLPS